MSEVLFVQFIKVSRIAEAMRFSNLFYRIRRCVQLIFYQIQPEFVAQINKAAVRLFG
jgi:hypothetical protein